MQAFKSVNELVKDHESCLEREFASAVVQQVSDAWAADLLDHEFDLHALTESLPKVLWNSSVLRSFG